MLMYNFCTYLKVLLVFTKICKAGLKGYGGCKRQLAYSKTVYTESKRVCEKDLKVRFPVLISFLSGQKKQCGGVCSEILHIQEMGSF